LLDPAAVRTFSTSVAATPHTKYVSDSNFQEGSTATGDAVNVGVGEDVLVGDALGEGLALLVLVGVTEAVCPGVVVEGVTEAACPGVVVERVPQAAVRRVIAHATARMMRCWLAMAPSWHSPSDGIALCVNIG